jgi:hypothetical protein
VDVSKKAVSELRGSIEQYYSGGKMKKLLFPLFFSILFFSCARNPSGPQVEYPAEVLFLVSGTEQLYFEGFYGVDDDTTFFDGCIPERIPNSVLFFVSIDESDTAFIQVSSDEWDSELAISTFVNGIERGYSWAVTPSILVSSFPF